MGKAMKKIIFLIPLIIIFISETVMAQDGPLSGLYGGINAGLSKVEITGFAETFPPSYQARKRTNLDIDKTTTQIKGQFGYGYHMDNGLFFGAELAYSAFLGGVDELISNTAINHEVEITYSGRLDGSILGGFSVGEKGLVYGRLGYGQSNINISPRDVGGTGGAFHDLSGVLFGGGYALALSEEIDIRLDVSRFNVSDSYNNDKQDDEIYDIDMKDTRATVGILYKF